MFRVKRAGEKFKNSNTGKYLTDFGKTTSFHGLPYIIRSNFHYIETLLWVVSVIISAACAISIILSSWNRYQANPTVISLDKNFRNWKIKFPAATVCFLDRLNETMAAEYILERWNIDDNSTEYGKYFNFLQSVSNLTLYNLKDFRKFVTDKELVSMSGYELASIARKVMVQMEYVAYIFDPNFKNMSFYETVTEFGICHTIGGIASNYITLSYDNLPKLRNLPTCNYLNAKCYGRISSFPANIANIAYYIHSPNEVAQITTKSLYARLNDDKYSSFTFNEMVASQDLRNLEPAQRKCRFFNEPLKGDKIYSYNICLMSCRKRLANSLCGCIPHLYLKSENTKICGVQGLACLSKFQDQLIRLLGSDGKRFECKCLLNCEFINFSLDQDIVRRLGYPAPPEISFRYGVESYSKTRMKREIIFGFQDLLVSFGGTAGFFLGCSVLSFVELVYFFTLRLFWFLVKRRKDTKRMYESELGSTSEEKF